LFIAHIILVVAYLVTQGIDPKSHPIKDELVSAITFHMLLKTNSIF